MAPLPSFSRWLLSVASHFVWDLNFWQLFYSNIVISSVNKLQCWFMQTTDDWTSMRNMSTLTLSIMREKWCRPRGCHEWEWLHPRLRLSVHRLVHYHRIDSWCNNMCCVKSKRIGPYTLYPTPIYISPPSNMTKHHKWIHHEVASPLDTTTTTSPKSSITHYVFKLALQIIGRVWAQRSQNCNLLSPGWLPRFKSWGSENGLGMVIVFKGVRMGAKHGV